MVSLAELWRAFGVQPDAVVGHSQGEIAAAVVCGALSLEDGARLAALRAKALIPLVGEGDMVSIATGPDESGPLLEPFGERLAIAAYNGPSSTVVSGEPAALKELLSACEAAGLRAKEIPVGYASHCAQVEAIEEELLGAVGELAPGAATVPLYSTLIGEPVEAEALNAEYWYRNLREPVRFEQVTRRLIDDGFTAFVEVSSHPVLAMALQETSEQTVPDSEAIAVLHTLRREEGGMQRFLSSLAQAHVEGIAVDFSPLFENSGAKRVDLPTYPFQRERFWLESGAGRGDPGALGLSAAEHPFLGASLVLANEGSQLLTGRLSLKSHPWLTDHAIGETALLPGVAFCELALRAGTEVGAAQLEELVLEAPLVLGEIPVQIQVTLNAVEGEERYEVVIHSRPEEDEEERPWTRHAQGTLTPQGAATGFEATAWPPPGADPLDTDAFYDLLEEVGLNYGPAFQGLKAAWRVGEELFAEVALAEEQRGEAERFAVHPALLDAALHAAFLEVEADAQMRLPFSFGGVSLGEGSGASALRVRVSVEGERIALEATDPEGLAVCSIASLVTRPLDPAQLQVAPRKAEALFRVEWAEVEVEAGEGVEVEVFQCTPDKALDSAQAAQALSAQALECLQTFLADEERAQSRLAFLTGGAMALSPSETPDPAAAAVWGLVRSAQSEHPGLFALIDTDGSEASEEALAAALSSEEPQLALRGGTARAPRLMPAGEKRLKALAEPWRLDAGKDGTFESISVIPSPEAARPLEAGEVRIAMHAAGLNFRDALIALGLYPEEASLGGEGAGVVVEVGPGVENLDPGDRVFGLTSAFGPLAIGESRMLAPLPAGWSFAQGPRCRSLSAPPITASSTSPV